MKASDFVKKKGKPAAGKGKKMNLMDWIGQRRKGKGGGKPMADDDEEC